LVEIITIVGYQSLFTFYIRKCNFVQLFVRQLLVLMMIVVMLIINITVVIVVVDNDDVI